ncbi:MAG: PAS domain-containing protein [Chloroflexi bacterium]|nr:PAS domain-containing protein [Chloroflexota bacterium]
MKTGALLQNMVLITAAGLILRWWDRRYRANSTAVYRAQGLLQDIPEGVIALNAHGRITFFSQSATRLTGWTASAAQGQLLADVLSVSENDAARLSNFLAEPRPLHLTLLTRPPVSLAITGTRLKTARGRDEGVVVVLRDITEAESGRSLHSYFLAHISHEFRTPLAGLNASIELLTEEYESFSPAEIDELLTSIHLSTSGLQALVDNLLESVNIEAGRFSIHRRPTEINRVLSDSVRMIQPLLDRRQQTLSLTEPLQVPPVNADPTRLTQVMINLLSNASKYSPQRSAIDLTVQTAGQMLRVTVADRGPGVPLTERENLYERFVRLNIHATEQAGMGLGLSVVKAIIEEHHGKVGVDERPGGGAVFWFTLPLKEGLD